MKTKQNSTWNKIVHAPFKKVIALDLVCMVIGAAVGIGIGAYLAMGGYVQ